MPFKVELPDTSEVEVLLNKIKEIFDRTPPTRRFAYAALVCALAARELYPERHSALIYEILFWLCVALAAGLFLWLLIRNARTRFATPSPEVKSALLARGLYCYVESDQTLFWKLGRRQDVRRFGGMVQDTQSPLFTVRGETGAGKTSFLRAGLRPWLQQQDIKCAYCDVSLPHPLGALARAAAVDLEFAVAGDLKTLVSIPTRAVIIIDSFEQLHSESPEHTAFCELLRAAHDQPAPHAVQFVVAFRENYKSIWKNIEQQTGIRAVEHALPLLSDDSASDAIETILEDAAVSPDRSVVPDYIMSIRTAAGTLPVDLAIGAQVFDRWAQRPHRLLRFVDYVNAGGAQGVLLEQVRDRLQSICASESICDALVRGLAECLLEQGTNKRRMSGASVAKLAEVTGLNAEDLGRSYLTPLASPDTRVLEALPGVNPLQYRLARDSVAVVLTQLKNQDFGTMEKRINLFVWDRFELWRKTQSRRDLLPGKLLNLIPDQDQGSGRSHADANMFTHYITKSRRARLWRNLRNGLGAVMGIAGLIGLVLSASAFTQETKLKSWRLPGELYAFQDRIKSLRIQGYAVTELEWLKPASFRDLEIVDSRRLASLSGINNIRSVENLTLDLTAAPITSLAEIAKLPGLTTLKLYLGKSAITELGDLTQAAQLRELTLELGGSQIKSIAPLSQMSHLETLRLQLAGSAVVDLADVPKMNGLCCLTIDLDATQLGLTADVTSAVNLRELTLNIENPRARGRTFDVENLSSLAGLKGLRKLTLNLVPPTADLNNPTPELDQPPVRDLGSLVFPDDLQDLAIDLGGFRVERLPELGDLKRLQQLGLHLCGTPIRSMPNIQRLPRLRTLDICLSAPKATGLRLAKLKLDELTLEVRGRNVSTAPKLSGLAGLRKLTFNIWQTNIANLTDLSTLRGVRNLELHLKWNQIAALPSLATLKDLQILTVHFIRDTDPESGTRIPAENLPHLGIQSELSDLALSLSGTTLEQIPDLSQFDRIKRLGLDLSDSKIQNLSGLLNLRRLEGLSIDLHNARMIRQLPDIAQLKELTCVALILDSTEVQDFPDTTTLAHLRRAKVSLRNSRITSLALTRRLRELREIVLDQRFNSLRDLPPSVERVVFWWGQ